MRHLTSASIPGPVKLLIATLLAILLAALILGLASRVAGAQPFVEIAPGLPEKANPCIAAGDRDGDGDLDVLVAAAGSHDVPFSTIYDNVGGTFVDSGIALIGLARATAAWGDYDGDGDLDLAMTGLTGTGITRTVIERNDGATFTELPGSLLGVFAGGIAWGDYDGDGRLDVVVTGTSALGLHANVWHNDGNGAFSDAGANLPGIDLGFTAWGDYDNDGDLDLLFGGNSLAAPLSRLYRNDGGTFTDANVNLMPLLWSSAAWGDSDNDGDLDIMLFGYDAVAQVTRSILYRNDAGAFVDSGAAFHNLFLGMLEWFDYDSDGDLDLLLAGNTSGLDILRIYRNDVPIPNTPPAAPGNLQANLVGTDVRFSWSAPADDHTPAAAMNFNLRVGTTPGGSELVSPMALSASGRRRVVRLGNAQTRTTWTVKLPASWNALYWSVQAIDGAFAGSPFAAEHVVTNTLAVGDGGSGIEFAVAGANPATGPARFRVTLPAAAHVDLAVFDAAGRRVATLYHGPMNAGSRTVTWERARPTPGLYFAVLEAMGRTVERKVAVLGR